MAEHDLRGLLSMILRKSRKILNADAGSLFLVEFDPEGRPEALRFELAQNDSMEVSLHHIALPIDHDSLAGFVASTKRHLRVDDVYDIDASAPYRFLKSIDEQTGYRSKSLLSVPMMDHKNVLIGVIQLWNKKKDPKAKLSPINTMENVLSFDDADGFILQSLASQAAIAIENAKLYGDIETLFEGFIRASVLAIESRDPTTSGHSERVAALTLGLAESVNECKEGALKQILFSKQDLKEIRYASLLHDFGKIGVKESILLKAKKLYPLELDVIYERLNLMHRDIQVQMLDQKIEHLGRGGTIGDAHWMHLESEYKNRIEKISSLYGLIQSFNEPSVTPEAISTELRNLEGLMGKRPDGSSFHLLEPDQLKRLSIPKGSLSEAERREIEAHVTYTFEFLSRIPWTSELRKVPEIAHAHHEKLNGTGYPLKKNMDGIPFPSQMMAVTDIYDALVARDRPYKKAIQPQKALEILSHESSHGFLNKDLVDLFIRKKVFLITTSS